MISPDVVIMTRAELEAERNRWFKKGVEHGRFEQACDEAQMREKIKDEYLKAGLVLLARHPAPDGDATNVGAQPAGQSTPSPTPPLAREKEETE